MLTEGLQHTLRNIAGCQVSAHLLVPGSTFTGMTRRAPTEKPPGAWTAEQVVDFMLERMAAGDFYILCPDNEVTREIDNARMTWAMQDLTQNRPPLSRWHPDYARLRRFLARRPGGPSPPRRGGADQRRGRGLDAMRPGPFVRHHLPRSGEERESSPSAAA